MTKSFLTTALEAINSPGCQEGPIEFAKLRNANAWAQEAQLD